MLNVNWEKYSFKIAALVILLGFFVGLVFVQIAVEKDREAERQRWLDMMDAEKFSISNVEGFSNVTVILTANYTGNVPIQIEAFILRDSQRDAIEEIDSVHEIVSVDEEEQFSVTFNAENIQLTEDYTVTLRTKKLFWFDSASFKFSSPG